ncbi:AraC family transcriptional regulator [Sphingobacterium chuzhouense]|uniref:AraC family transcriptional regulator n=1 Tax=Sphingobacterium chuzhouense TaxID=1742264 RepID=A0ABR7XR45_9SPHI|nr:helix-turn-helix domain-containing protein [Sphingobacterium chuzhouense]MBD1421613.1 AraC family transcriptional regulator [Sphingobacterium chuzhouense]
MKLAWIAFQKMAYAIHANFTTFQKQTILMKKSMHLCLHAYFEQVRSLSDLTESEPRTLMRNAEATYWKNKGEEALLQEFDGHQGYLYYIDVLLQKERCIPFETDHADLHILYVLSNNNTISVNDQQTNAVCQVAGQRAVYLYLPTDEYQFHLPQGVTTIFGFYFRASIFRKGNERSYDFIHPLLDAHRQQSEFPLASRDFLVGPRTRYHIERLCENLHPTQLNNDHFVMGKLLDLIDLSRIKIVQEDTKIHYERHIAEEARELLALYIAHDGQSAELKKLEDDLAPTLATINRLHKRYFGTTLQQLRDDLLLERACDLLQSGLSPTECAYELNYNSPEAFYHFFKKNKGLSPLSYLKTL